MSDRYFFDHGSRPTRRELFHGAAGVLAAGTMLLLSGRRALAKMTQKSVHYQNKPKGSEKCATCVHFQSPASCNVVAGKINPGGWCQLYTKK